MLLDSIRKFYNNLKVIIADDSLEPEPIHRENILHYIMPPAQVCVVDPRIGTTVVFTKYAMLVQTVSLNFLQKQINLRYNSDSCMYEFKISLTYGGTVHSRV